MSTLMNQETISSPALVNAKCVLASTSANIFSSCSAYIGSHGAEREKTEACIVYGAGRQIAIWWCQNPSAYPAIELLKGHAAQVTVVKSLHTEIGMAAIASGIGFLSSSEYRFISGDAKGTLRIWGASPPGADGARSWKTIAELTGHQRSISCLASLQLPNFHSSVPSSSKQTTHLILSGASDGRLMMWTLVARCDDAGEAVAELIQTIELGNKIAMDACLTRLPGQSDGHTDWVRCLDFIADPSNPQNLLLASGSQDGYIRLWRCSRARDPSSETEHNVKCRGKKSDIEDLLVDDPFKALDELTQTLKDEGKISIASVAQCHHTSRQSSHLKVEMKKYRIVFPSNRSAWNMTSEAVLFGHEGWVTNVHWAIDPDNELQLISTSSDRSMILWKPSADHNGIWLNSERFGELTGSSNLGFFAAFYFCDPDKGEEAVLASGWTGGWHRWGRHRSIGPQDTTLTLWEPQIAPTGHSQAITGLEWDREGEYILTCSHDQTTRLWGPWRRPNNVPDELSTTQIESWHELGRPQVHGHDLFGLSFINDKRTQFVSISEEKVIRAFDATESFIRLVNDLNTTKVPYEVALRKRYKSATIPPLGLSNRVEETASLGYSNENTMNNAPDLESSARCPPFQDELLTCTLWPEIDKLYGHPSELSAIATSACGKLIASACNATSAASASIRIHLATTFRPAGDPLESHQLTVTQLAFNHNDSLLVSVSRDRGWALWKPAQSVGNVPREETGFVLMQKFEKAHTRIIWDVSWGPEGSEVFATGSRDKTVKVWSKIIGSDSSPAWALSATIKFADAVRACKFVPFLFNRRLILCVGSEDGAIHLYSAHPEHPGAWDLAGVLSDQHTHTGPVERLAFCPKPTDQGMLRLASGGEDGVIRITDILLQV